VGWAGCSRGFGCPRRRAPLLRLFTLGHVRQLDAVAAGFLARLATATPSLSGARQAAFVDLDDTVRATVRQVGRWRDYTAVNSRQAARQRPRLGARQGPTEDHSGKAGQTGRSPTPHSLNLNLEINFQSSATARCIQAEAP
jgi:hypothetical protein